MGVLIGCDFSSSPSKRKGIVCAKGAQAGGRLVLHGLEKLASLDEFSAYLEREPSWLGAFDLPFGLPRELVAAMGWPLDWEACIKHYAALGRDDIRAAFVAFCDARPVGGKFAHRATDLPAQSSPSMKWVNPPVAFMLHAGVPRLMSASAYFPGLQIRPARADADLRVALEAYPGLIAKAVLGSRSYKSDEKAKQTPERLIARKDLVTALEMGQTRWGVRLKLSHAQRDALVDDPSGDSLDAVLCLVLAAWAELRYGAGAPLYGLPLTMDPLEGWIVSA
ncbi:MAG: DUF429 domain-containing protein [Rhodoferax sp.]|uniref:DUF429 domain-containing protein n=1 Tax=Rhodoferax sp. TaxID=50421 RepID=UPI002ACEFAE1|nr:DUF429 domain-containing protein [Rhodoferax sp.]MDZ7891404.1 DUF429 domain-containing protein [Rhodoferax sp.]